MASARERQDEARGTHSTTSAAALVSLAPALTVPALLRCAEHVRQLGGESPLDNLMEVKS